MLSLWFYPLFLYKHNKKLTCPACAIVCLLMAQGTIAGTSAPKQYVVDLDLPEEFRWVEVVKDHREIVTDFRSVIRTFVPRALMKVVEWIGETIDDHLPAPYAGEMKGIALAANTSLGDIVIINLLYDVTAFCTSIVSQDSMGQIWHSRNLDYAFADILKNLTIAVDFRKAGKTIYSAVTFAGYIGVLTGQKPKEFTITVDERDEGHALWNLIIGLLDHSVIPVSFLVRNVLSDSANFTEAVNTLAYAHTAAPVYFIAAGVNPGEAAVVTKGRLKPDDIWKIDPENGRWFEVETNYDHWKPPPPDDNRRKVANKAMQKLGRFNISVTSLFEVMSVPLVLNKNTVYTVVMSARKSNLMQTWIRL